MLFDFKPGDRVNFTNDLGGGIIFKIDGETILVEDDNGILLHLTWKDVVPIFKPEKDLPVYRTEADKKAQPPTGKNKFHNPFTEKKTREGNITPKPSEFDWQAKPTIKKVKDKSAAIEYKDPSTAPDVQAVQTDEETGLPEIDLHLHELLENESGMDDYDKLQYQLNYLRKELRRLHQMNTREAVIIHGVGKGRLRDEVRALLAEQSSIVDFFDGSFKKYGAGATQVVFKGK
jgi:DNA-nicking Smr family endonuclease